MSTLVQATGSKKQREGEVKTDSQCFQGSCWQRLGKDPGENGAGGRGHFLGPLIRMGSVKWMKPVLHGQWTTASPKSIRKRQKTAPSIPQ